MVSTSLVTVDNTSPVALLSKYPSGIRFIFSEMSLLKLKATFWVTQAMIRDWVIINREPITYRIIVTISTYPMAGISMKPSPFIFAMIPSARMVVAPPIFLGPSTKKTELTQEHAIAMITATIYPRIYLISFAREPRKSFAFSPLAPAMGFPYPPFLCLA